MTATIEERTLHQDIVAEGYYSTQKLIRATARRFNQIFGGDLEEQLDQAVFLFVEADQRYDESKARSYSSWVRFFVWKNLLEKRRVELNHARLLPREYRELTTIEARAVPSAIHLIELIDSLKEDAAALVRLVFERPLALKKDIRREGDETPARIRVCLRRYLLMAGWTAARVRDAFQEVARALQD